MRIGFAGAGSMAGAMARGFRAHGPGSISMLFADAGSGRADALAGELDGESVAGLERLAEASELVILAVKPKALDRAAAGLAGFDGVLVSLLGATTVAHLERAFPGATVLRTMPNVAVEVGRGVICHAPPAEPEAVAPALELLGTVATLVELEEKLLDPATAVMGCTPAYLALACEALTDAGAEAGLDPALSDRLVRLAAAGTGDLLLGHEADELQRIVASPGGSTEAGLEALAEHRAPQAFAAAVAASLERMAGTR
jgi:pyrroline-5-carboxylate reductase